MARTRKFNGKTYRLVRLYRIKSDAEKWKKRVKSSYGGGYTRIIPVKGGYSVWVRIA